MHGRQEEKMDVSEALKKPICSAIPCGMLSDLKRGPAEGEDAEPRRHCWNPAALVWLVLDHRKSRNTVATGGSSGMLLIILIILHPTEAQMFHHAAELIVNAAHLQWKNYTRRKRSR